MPPTSRARPSGRASGRGSIPRHSGAPSGRDAPGGARAAAAGRSSRRPRGPRGGAEERRGVARRVVDDPELEPLARRRTCRDSSVPTTSTAAPASGAAVLVDAEPDRVDRLGAATQPHGQVLASGPTRRASPTVRPVTASIGSTWPGPNGARRSISAAGPSQVAQPGRTRSTGADRQGRGRPRRRETAAAGPRRR